MSGLSLSGLASGLDTSTIVTQLMAIERQGQTKLKQRQSAMQTQSTALQDIKSKLSSLQSAAQALGSRGTWGATQTTSSSDTTRVGVDRTGGVAPPGGWSVGVQRLASGAQRTYDFTQQSSARSLTISGVQVDLPADATLSAAVSAINAKSESPVYAAAVGDKLVLTTKATGTSVANPVATGVTENGTPRAGQNAQYTIDGGTVQESATNVVENALPGLRLTLKAPTTGSSPAVVTASTPGIDTEAIKTKLKDFVTAYNAVVTTVSTKVTEKSSETDATKGQLFGDSALITMMSRMRTAVSESVSGLSGALDQLGDLGISTGAATGTTSADAKLGKLVIDDAKLTAALADPAAIQKLLSGPNGNDGFAKKLADIAGAAAGTGGTLASRIDGVARQVRGIADQMTRTEERLTQKEARLRAQFTAMESALSNAQSQQSWLSGQIAALG
jgi:flagellar hook-associated protein 2